MKSTYIILLTLLALLTQSCNDFLNRNPISSASPDTFWKSKDDASAWLAGTYDQLQSTLKGNFVYWGESRSDNLTPNIGVAQGMLYRNSLAAGETSLAAITSWSGIYATIARCNFGIKYMQRMIDNDIDGASATYKDYIGQYYGLKALMYFYGVRVWGRVPLVSNEPLESYNPKNPEEQYYPRASMDDCKLQIMSNLDSCLKYIPYTQRVFYFSRASALALKADFQLWFKDYDNVIKTVNELESLKYYSWISTPDDWKKIFTEPEASSETIFSIKYDAVMDGGSSVASFFGSSSNTSQFLLADKIVNMLYYRNTANNYDVRWTQCIDTISYFAGNGVLQFGKYYKWDPGMVRTGTNEKGGFAYDPAALCSANIPIYRYADVELMKAVAYYFKGGNDNYNKALDIVNNVRKRVGYLTTAKIADFTNSQSILDCIMDERQLELFGEGKRWFDLIQVSTNNDYFHKVMDPEMAKRTGSSDFLNANEGKILFPINSNAFTANPKLIGDQNPPYSE